MPNPKETMREIYTKGQDMERWPEIFTEYYAPDVRCTATGGVDYQGDDHGLGYLEAWAKVLPAMGITGHTIDVRHIVGDDRVAVVERIDHFLGHDGSAVLDLDCISVFEFGDDGRITAVREYADPNAWVGFSA